LHFLSESSTSASPFSNLLQLEALAGAAIASLKLLAGVGVRVVVKTGDVLLEGCG